MVTDLPGQPDDHVLVGGGPDQRLGLDGLDVAGAAGRQHRGRGRRVGAALLRCQVARLLGVEVIDDPASLPLDLAHDGVDLDRAGQVVDEVDEHPDTGQPEHQRPGHGQAGHERLPAGALDPDRMQPGRAVSKGPHEHAEHQLGAAVTHEVAQQPGRVLAGGDLQGDDGEGEHQPGDRDHGR
jgi:hypothetical protein